MNDSMNQLAFIFPGQGSQSVGMMGALAAEFDCVKERFGEASEAVGIDLWTLANDGPPEELNLTANTQPALLAASVATWDIWRTCGGPEPAYMAGHSFGEYSALVCAGALEFSSAARLVAARGRFMQAAVPAGEGAMAAVLGLELGELEQICEEFNAGDMICACANLNAPGQIVIAGSTAAVDQACSAAKVRGAKRAMILPVSAPAHCALMAPAAAQLGEELASLDINAPRFKIIHNVDVSSHTDANEIRNALIGQMTAPVRWIETIELIQSSGVTQLIECGPGKVLSGLVKRITKDLSCANIGDAESVRNQIEKVGEMNA